jgi:photosystem II stability/assembly factor-like uncharacterized protein
VTDPSLARLRAINPVTDETSALPIALIRARIADEAGSDARAGRVRLPRRRRALAHLLIPTLSIAVALIVALVALITVRHGVRAHRAVTSTQHGTHPPSRPPGVRLPRGGMPGVVQLWGSALSSQGTGIVSFEQCNPCGGTQRFTEWMAVTADGGVRWVLRARPFYLFAPQFSGARDVWGGGQDRGAIINGVWVSHDAGSTWSRVTLTGATNEPGDVSAAGGEVWAVAAHCGATCATTILHGSAAGSTLTATVSQPAAHAMDAQVIAAGAGSAYLATAVGHSTRRYVTHDDGRTWQVTSNACRAGIADTALAADGPTSLWEQCTLGHGHFVVARSTDSGHHWTEYPMPFGGLRQLELTGGGSAWALSDTGVVIRTVDGGATWTAVLRPGRETSLLAASAQSAAVVRAVGRGHVDHHSANTNLIAYRTTDGGTTWRPSVVRLPTG